MELAFVILVFSTLCFAIAPTLASSISKPGCPETCGNVTIPYPFGIGSECSANSSFTVICKNSTGNMVPFLSNINLEVKMVSLCGVVIVNLPVSIMNCSEGRQTRESIPISLKGSPLTVSALYNTFFVLGCKAAVWFHDDRTQVGGCLPMCDDANSTDVTRCDGVNCCQTPIPRRAQEFQFTYQIIQPSNSSFCGYVFLVDSNWWVDEDYRRQKGFLDDLSNPFDREFRFVPLVLEWEFGNQDGYCSSPDSNSECPRDPYVYETYLDYPESTSYVSTRKYCTCGGYEGNPYIHDGCPHDPYVSPFSIIINST